MIFLEVFVNIKIFFFINLRALMKVKPLMLANISTNKTILWRLLYTFSYSHFFFVYFGLVLWHINHCWLFNAKSFLYMYIKYI